MTGRLYRVRLALVAWGLARTPSWRAAAALWLSDQLGRFAR